MRAISNAFISVRRSKSTVIHPRLKPLEPLRLDANATPSLLVNESAPLRVDQHAPAAGFVLNAETH
eukprot:3471754-Lingulodinium_polyedra.AAC.1